MKIVKIVTVVLVGVLAFGLVAGPALGQTCDTTFIGDSGEPWQENSNWTFDAPDADKVACIPADKRCVIETHFPATELAFAKAIVVSADATNTGELEIQAAVHLTIYEDSTVDGVVTMFEKSQLLIAADLDITGNGGEIIGIPPGPGLSAGKIYHTDSSDHTTLLTTRAATPGSPDTSLVLRGALEIAVKLRHHTYIVADNGNLYLTQHTKWPSALGNFIAEGGGNLIVQAEVKGQADWLIQDAGSTIKISVDCPLLTGDVVMTDGRLEADNDFLTTGNASIKSIDNGMGGFTEPEIWVAETATVRFGS